ncbi:MAG: PhoH family protein [Azovibrio sp.]|nr:PhoH family protein [Azovibrio sp.]
MARRSSKKAEATKIFVLDTNVLMHDPTSLFRFEEHDIFIPIMTLEELDSHKKGMSEIARNARQVSRSLDEMLALAEDIEEGIPLAAPSNGLASGRLFLQTEAISSELPPALPTSKYDNQILAVVIHLQRRYPKRPVILVSKDINMRIKARSLGLPAEDYFNDKVLEDTDLLYPGARALPADFWETHGQGMESWKKDGRTYYRVNGPLCPDFLLNEFVYLDGEPGFAAQVKEAAGKQAVLETLVDYSHPKHAVWGINARNREQNFALNLLMDPEIDFVTLLGQAGTGKTLLTLAAGLTQVLESKRYAEIIMTRITVPVGEDIGFLPGTEEEKMAPWMGALEDNLEVLTRSEDGGGAFSGEWSKAATTDLIRSRIKVKSLNFMRGRTFLNKFLIIDEAQNLTPKQMKTLITRAGPGTKVVCLGNIAQIDTPYLTEGSSGLTYVVDRFKGWIHAGHITLQRGERSRLADHAAEVL